MTESLRQRPGDQPLPTEGQEDVQASLIREIEARRCLGVQRYGRPLQTFNGRDAGRDLLDELLDGAAYAMQVRMEREATQARINRALGEHQADFTGQCYSCRVASPCTTRRILTGQQSAEPVTIIRVDPIEEVACSPDAVGYVRDHFQVEPVRAAINSGPRFGEYMGLPVYVDDALPPRTVRLQPHSPKQ